ncbi:MULTISPECIES: hypothetical protein [unclassified Leptolyngbya]|uniref:hypothetical protein n=1 Tax=unclassified Leptolyngbya TaxID=2650499 RepID=UPI0016894D62|nr:MULTISPECIES: hypothetical protein [unclassified Leptolyngbya]MBD1911444.1 hypothetical protein [Leptolyngbya sp. FACHB-8]MBD2153456.1 hypothetical protein [Leptolyngbya sp. FACHB-16]
MRDQEEAIAAEGSQGYEGDRCKSLASQIWEDWESLTFLVQRIPRSRLLCRRDPENCC